MPLDDLTNSTNGSVAASNGDSDNPSNSAESTNQEFDVDAANENFAVNANAYLDDNGGLHLEFYLPPELHKQLYDLSLNEADQAEPSNTVEVVPQFISPRPGGFRRVPVPIGRASRFFGRPPRGRSPR